MSFDVHENTTDISTSMIYTTTYKAERRLLQLLESENWDAVRDFLENGHQLSRPEPNTLVECMELAMLAVRKAPEFLLPMLMECIDLRHIFPSMRSEYDRNRVYYTPLLHNVCLDHKHEAVALVLHSLGPENARKEASRFDHVHLLLGQDKHHWDYEFLYTPIQSAWETMLVEDFPQVLENVASLEDLWSPLHLNLLNLWLTSMYLLMAMDGQPITPLHKHRPTYWSVTHAIARAGHRMHSAVMWLALLLYPESISSKDADGNCVLHIIASNSIYYRSLVHHHQQLCAEASSFMEMHTQAWEQTSFHAWEQSPLQMILSKGKIHASIPDKNGRLPLHLLLVSYEKNQEQYAMLKNQQRDFDSEGGFTLNVQDSIDALLNAFPTAIEARDPLTGLLPFMLAASVRSMPLDIIYNLLIRDPTLVNSWKTSKRKYDAWDSTSSTLQGHKKRIHGQEP